jgi:hypothetical protein
MGLKDVSELIEKFVGGEVGRDAGQGPGYPSVYYFSVLLGFCCTVICGVVPSSALLKITSYNYMNPMLSWQKELYEHVQSMYRTAQYIS